MMRILTLMFLACSITACASTKNDFKFDGSSIQSTQASIQSLQDQLSKNEQKEFMMALLAISLSETNGYEFIANAKKNGYQLNLADIGTKINGLSYKEILALAESSPTKVIQK